MLSRRRSSDGGGEFTGAPFREACAQFNISQTFTSRDTPQFNGRVERANRTVNECIDTLLLASGQDEEWWPHAMDHALYCINRQHRHSGDSRYCELFGEAPNLRWACEFGAHAMARSPTGDWRGEPR